MTAESRIKGTEINIMIIGFGPHAKRIYYPIIKNLSDRFDVHIRCVVDLEQKKFEVENFLEKQLGFASCPVELFFLTPGQKTFEKLHPTVTRKLNELVDKNGINAVVISTEPLVHMQYAEWALQAGLHIMMDKPLSVRSDIATNIKQAQRLSKDYEKLERLLRTQRKSEPAIVFDLMAQRRLHPAFLKIRELINEVYQRTGMPISSISSIHSDGQWRFPTEIRDQDYHPYNQGYGKCSHSGYHTIDTVTWLLESTSREGKGFNNIDVYSNFLKPLDFYSQLTLEDYRSLFPDYDEFNPYSEELLSKEFRTMGEVAAFVSMSFKQKDTVSALVNLSMIHNGSSQRNWVTAAGRDLYKGNGRIRHESHYISQGPFQSISFESYQSKELKPGEEDDLYEVGGEYHLDIHVFRNNVMFPEWTSYQKYSIKDLGVRVLEGESRGHQEDARRACLMNFLDQISQSNLNDSSSFESHRTSVLLHSAIYQSAARKYSKKNPVVNIRID
ncbi:MAG: Gfo/Idh/MocA family oxidoreductase [Patescibacteria group bacterium]